MEATTSFLQKENENVNSAWATETSRAIKIALLSYRCCILCFLAFASMLIGAYFVFDRVLKDAETIKEIVVAFRNITPAG